MKKFTLTSLTASIALATVAHAELQVKVLDTTHNPASNFLAYTEFELSGEPLAEALGLDLDILDPNAVNKPSAFDYAAGIESYEYSEEAMYALNYQSQMGPHLVNGPVNAKRGGAMDAFSKRLVTMAEAVGFPAEEVPSYLHPISLPYQSGLPKLNLGKVSTNEGDELEVITAKGNSSKQQTLTNAYLSDYSTLAWDSSSFDKTINPSAVGGILLKEVMWSQDFLGGMHEMESDEEVEATSSTMDQDDKYSLGVSAADGFQGMLLTEISLDKMLILQNQLGFDGKNLGVSITPNYDPKKQPIWFANQVAVNETNKSGYNALGKLTVKDSRSTLRDTWMLLWPTSEYFAYTDQRQGNTAQNPAFLSVFDGAPFASAPTANTDASLTNNVVAEDAFSVTANLNNLLFKNIDALHFNAKAGTFVDDYKAGKLGQTITTFDASYALVALSIFQRAQDALPVGYASAAGGDVNLKTANGQRALELIQAQSDFLLNNAIGSKGLVVDNIQLGNKNKASAPQSTASANQSLATQFAAIRGLVAAGLATKNDKYLAAAKGIYLAVEKHLFDAKLGTWSDQPGKIAHYTPWTAAAISGGLREVMLHLANQEGESEPALALRQLSDRYVAWFKITINGGLQLAEFDADTGENRLQDLSITDSDQDGVLSIIGAGYAPVMANKISISAH